MSLLLPMFVWLPMQQLLRMSKRMAAVKSRVVHHSIERHTTVAGSHLSPAAEASMSLS